jgi:hypothetical protein
MKPVCEICHEPIEEPRCIILSPFEHKYCHLSCFRKRITDAFSDVIGTQDDMIDELVADACEDMLTGHTPSEVEEPIYDGSV